MGRCCIWKVTTSSMVSWSQRCDNLATPKWRPGTKPNWAQPDNAEPGNLPNFMFNTSILMASWTTCQVDKLEKQHVKLALSSWRQLGGNEILRQPGNLATLSSWPPTTQAVWRWPTSTFHSVWKYEGIGRALKRSLTIVDRNSVKFLWM